MAQRFWISEDRRIGLAHRRLAILDRTARATGWKTPAASRFSSSRRKAGSYLGEDDIERFDDVYGRRNS